MTVPTVITDLSATAASNSPAGTDNVFPDLDNFIRAQSGFIRQLYDSSLTLAGSGGAALVGNAPSGTIAATTVQGAINEIVSDLAASSGSSLVGYLPSGTGAVASTVQSKLRESVSVKDFGAKGDGVTDDTAAIQAAINKLGPNGGILNIPPGKYLVSNAGSGYCLTIQYPIHIVGAGPMYCSIFPSSVSSTTDVIQLYPSASYATDGTTIEGLFVGDPNTGLCGGRNSIYVVTSVTGQYLPKLTVRNCSVGTSTYGSSFRHINTSPDAQGGMWGALIENNQFRSGVYLAGTGDSNVIRNNIITGSNAGVYISQKTGASCLSIEENNITATGGAIVVDYASRISIRHNNIEIPSGAGSNFAVIDFNGVGSVSYGGVVSNNLISSFGTSTVTTGIRVKNTYGLHIEDNVFLSGVAGYVTAVNVVDGSALGTRIGPNTYNTGSGNFTPAAYAAGTTYALGAYVSSNNGFWKSLQAANLGHTPLTSPTWWSFTSEPTIVDGGQGTCGVVKPISLAVTAPQWTIFGSINSVPYIYKDLSGVVHLQGTISSGLATAGTTLFYLPEYFRPKNMCSFPCYSTGGATAGVGAVQVYDTASGAGAVTIMLGGNTLLCLDGISFAANKLADGNSLE